MRADIAAIVLAAGLSSRMGRFKPLLPLGEATVLERVVRLFQAAGVAEVKVVLGHRAGELSPLLRGQGIQAVLNPRFEQGMFSSVAAGVASLGQGVAAFFVHPVDIPLVRPETVRGLREAYGQGGYDIVYPSFKGRRGHPPLISAHLADPLGDWKGESGLKGFLRQYEERALDLAVNDEFILRDMDEPEEYARLAEACRRRTGQGKDWAGRV